MIKKPHTQYTQSGSINIAYQVYGQGEVDLIYIPGWVSNIDLMWDCPPLVKFLHGLSQMARVILFDKRGTGLSDRLTELSTIEDRMDDIRAVMDAVKIKKAILFGHSEGGSVSALFSATYPERTIALITFGVFAKRQWSPDYPWAPTDEERQEVYDMIQNNWGSGDMNISSLAPSRADDPVFMDWLSRYFRSGASPSSALALTKMNTEVDIIDILETINVPSLFICRTDDIDVKVEESKFMASKIKDAKVVEFEGDDHLFWVGNSEEVLMEMGKFILGYKPMLKSESKLVSILGITLSNTLDQLAYLNNEQWRDKKESLANIVEQLVKQFRGIIHDRTPEHFLATFDGPSKAVHCALALRDATRPLEVEIQQAVHLGECVIDVTNKIEDGFAIAITKRIASMANASQVLTTQTTKNILSGTGLDFVQNGELKINSIDKTFRILSVNDVVQYQVDDIESAKATFNSKNHSFLEDVLQEIQANIDDIQYGLDDLCRSVGVSPRQLQRKLKKIANKTPNQLIRSTRLHNARRLIVVEGASITDALYMSGFSSQSYFSKCFKSEFGISPTELKKE